MSNTLDISFHRIVSIDFDEVKAVGEARWQDIHFRTLEGDTQTICVFLGDGYPGFSAFTRPETPKRREEDVPRQPALETDLDLKGDS